MAVSSGISLIITSISAILLFSAMQMHKPWIISTQYHTIIGGYAGCVLFIFLLTACGNLESIIFGKTKQMQLPEVTLCLLCAIFATASIHKISATSCMLFSLISLYYINKHSSKVYANIAIQSSIQSTKKRR